MPVLAQGSASERNRAPASAICLTTANRSKVERARRSVRVTITTSPAASSRSIFKSSFQSIVSDALRPCGLALTFASGCGRRFGKTELAKSWIMQGLVQGEACAWIAPQHMTSAEVFHDLRDRLEPLLQAGSRADGVMRLATGGRLDLWSLENPITGRGRGYSRVVIDEAAYTRPGDSHSIGSMLNLWETAIKPTLYDHAGQALVCSNDATAVTCFAYDRLSMTQPLCILDWDLAQIEGALLEAWLPSVFTRLDELARECGARYGSIGAYIEDKNSGTILLQQALRRGYPAQKIESRLTAMGKDERALSVSGYVHRGLVKYTEHAFNKIAEYKRNLRNHLLDQVESFRIGDNHRRREDDLLDTFCYGIAMALGNNDGF